MESGVALISATEIVKTYAGLILAGSLLSEGLITTKSVLIALLLGKVVSFSARFARHSLFALARIAFWTTVRGKTVAINAGTTLVIHVLLIVVLLII